MLDIPLFWCQCENNTSLYIIAPHISRVLKHINNKILCSYGYQTFDVNAQTGFLYLKKKHTCGHLTGFDVTEKKTSKKKKTQRKTSSYLSYLMIRKVRFGNFIRLGKL